MKTKMTDNVSVAVRVRPFIESEMTRGCQSCIDCIANERQVQICDTDKAFTYNFVFGPNDSQEYFYVTAVKSLVERLFEGYNVTVLAYGQTGSGKTYTMGTNYAEDGVNMGVIPRAVYDIYSKIHDMPNWEFKVTVSFIELYCEQLYDLLAPNRPVVDIREDGKGVKVPGLTEVAVSSGIEVIELLKKGSSGRITGETAMNSQSSRSHAIFTICMHQESRSDSDNATISKFHLVDLAGSERPKKTKATGERFKEGVNINKGLLALGNVIAALCEDGQKNYISYRDSKLTRLLQDSLGGNSLTLMVACVSPADYNVDETISTLRYADRAWHIKNKPVVNQDPKAGLIAQLKQQIQELQMELSLRSSSEHNSLCIEKLMEENGTLLKKNCTLTDALNNAYSENTGLLERAVLTEICKDRLKVKLCEVKMKCSQTLQSFSEMENVGGFKEQLHQFKDLHNTIQDLQIEEKCSEEETLFTESDTDFKSNVVSNTSEEGSSCNKDDPVAFDECREALTMQRLELNRELQELNRVLTLKEQLAAELASNSTKLSSIPNYEGNVADMEKQISVLQNEKESLLKDLAHKPSTSSTSKDVTQYEKKISDLEHRISELKSKIAEQQKIIKIKENSQQTVNKLNSEIQNMKQEKVRLIKQMKVASQQFRQWKSEQQREFCKLKDKERKQQIAMVQMEKLYTKQQNVLKRKFEGALAANKRLKVALAVQKLGQDRRAQQVSSNKIQTWITQELEVLLRTVEAEKTLEQLVEDRAVLNQQLLKLKKKSSGNSEEKMKQLEEEISLRSSQIMDLKQKIMDSDQENKAKSRWDTIQSMSEAKHGLEYLFEVVTDLKKETVSKDSRLEEMQATCSSTEKSVYVLQQKLKDSNQTYQQSLLQFEKEHEEKVGILLARLQLAEEKLCSYTVNDNESTNSQGQVENSKPKNAKPSMTKSLNSLVPPLFYDRDEVNLLEESVYEGYDDKDADPDWQKTPIFRRIQNLKRKGRTTDIVQPMKQSLFGEKKCGCKTGKCSQNRCSCRKNDVSCSSLCKCSVIECTNRVKEESLQTSENHGEPSPKKLKSTSEEDQIVME